MDIFLFFLPPTARELPAGHQSTLATLYMGNGMGVSALHGETSGSEEIAIAPTAECERD